MKVSDFLQLPAGRSGRLKIPGISRTPLPPGRENAKADSPLSAPKSNGVKRKRAKPTVSRSEDRRNEEVCRTIWREL